jgi:hypothetical protein
MMLGGEGTRGNTYSHCMEDRRLKGPDALGTSISGHDHRAGGSVRFTPQQTSILDRELVVRRQAKP